VTWLGLDAGRFRFAGPVLTALRAIGLPRPVTPGAGASLLGIIDVPDPTSIRDDEEERDPQADQQKEHQDGINDGTKPMTGITI
jgi:hypothetical protein